MAKKRPGLLSPTFATAAAEATYRGFRNRRDTEEALWKKWNKGGRTQADLIPLMRSLEPLVRSEARKYSGSAYGNALVPGANETELRRRLLKAIQRYRPGMGGTLTNFVYVQFRDFSATAAKRRNFSALSKQDTQGHAAYQNAHNELLNEGFLNPTHEQLADRLEWPVSRVARVSGGHREEHFVGAGPTMDMPSNMEPDQARSIMSLVRFRNEDEKKVFVALGLSASGTLRRQKITVAQVARKLKMSEAKVRAIRAELKRRVEPLLRSV